MKGANKKALEDKVKQYMVQGASSSSSNGNDGKFRGVVEGISLYC
tara:strand:- start:103 stop:237 length:135 start_codon:yes stop_codon:yes gene_type:complete